MTDFENEVNRMQTSDIVLILKDQVDLYSDEELSILRKALQSRKGNNDEIRAAQCKESMRATAQKMDSIILTSPNGLREDTRSLRK